MKISIVTTAYKAQDFVKDYLYSIRDQIVEPQQVSQPQQPQQTQQVSQAQKPQQPRRANKRWSAQRSVYVQTRPNPQKITQLKQEKVEYEVLLGIDGCVDTLNAVKKIQSENNFEWLKIYWNEHNKGTYIMRNTLAKLAEGQHLVFFDSDDVMKPIFLRRIQQEVMTTSCGAIYYYGLNFTGKNVGQKIKSIASGGVGTFYILKTIFMSLGGYKPWRCAADTDFKLRVNAKKIHVRWIKEPLFYRRIVNTSLTNSKQYGFASNIRKGYVNNLYNSSQSPIIKMEVTHVKLVTTKPKHNVKKIGILGVGVVGGAVWDYFSQKQDIECVGYDKYAVQFSKDEQKTSLLTCDVVFICLPTLYNETMKSYNYEIIEEYLKWLSENEYKQVIVIKSTIEPLKTQEWNDKYSSLKLVHNPEFLTSRTNKQDFENQQHIVIGYTKQSHNACEAMIEFFKHYFPKAHYSVSTSTETELMKIWCNSFYAVKVQVFNEIFENCKNTGADFEKVRSMMLKNNWINPMHTNVPGPDGQFSYGGMCFPKDTNALLEHLKRLNSSHDILEATINERNRIRND